MLSPSNNRNLKSVANKLLIYLNFTDIASNKMRSTDALYLLAFQNVAQPSMESPVRLCQMKQAEYSSSTCTEF